jgi:hypothetical protein
MEKPARRRALRIMAGIAGLPGLSGILQNVLAAGNRPVSPGIQKLDGDVRVNGQHARLGMLIETGDTVSTGRDSEAIYVIGQDAFLQRANSTTQFSGVAASVMRVITGRILSVFGRGRKTLQTATATIGIRGTGCYIESEPERVYFCLCYGKAELTPTADPSHTVEIETTHHDHPVYIHSDSSKPMMVDAAIINHSDAELELLENLVGRWPPFKTGSYRY